MTPHSHTNHDPFTPQSFYDVYGGLFEKLARQEARAREERAGDRGDSDEGGDGGGRGLPRFGNSTSDAGERTAMPWTLDLVDLLFLLLSCCRLVNGIAGLRSCSSAHPRRRSACSSMKSSR